MYKNYEEYETEKFGQESLKIRGGNFHKHNKAAFEAARIGMVAQTSTASKVAINEKPKSELNPEIYEICPECYGVINPEPNNLDDKCTCNEEKKAIVFK